MPANRNHTFRIAAQHRLTDDTLHERIIFSTCSKEVFDRVCLMVAAQQINTPRPNSGQSLARAIELRSIVDPTKAYQARASGVIKDIPKLRTQWPSLRAAADAVGFTYALLNQAMYRARKEAGGTDSPATVHGLCFAYVKSEAVSI